MSSDDGSGRPPPSTPSYSPWEKAAPRAGDAPPRFEADGVRALADAANRALNDAADERRRLRRRAWWWRLIALGALVLIVITVVARQNPTAQPHIARYDVFGVIADDRARDALLDRIAEDDTVKALIVRIDSPGGTTVGGEALFESLRRVSDKKPVVAVMGEVAASAGYIAALAADHIVARGNTITASIGVILTAPNFSGALEAIGVEVVEVKSGDQKAEPSPYKPIQPESLALEEVLIADSFDWFVGLVRDRREISATALREVSDGRILTGRMAHEMNLVDALGGEREAIDWLEVERDVDADLPVLDHAPPSEEETFLGGVFDEILGWRGWAGAGLDLAGGPILVSRAR